MPEALAVSAKSATTLARVCLIIPVLNEANAIAEILASLDQPGIDVIVVDGGSEDDTVKLAKSFDFCRVIQSARGRAIQMNAGAKLASNDILVFLHADTFLPDNFLNLLQTDFWQSDKAWGRFNVRLSGGPVMLRVIEFMMNQRSYLTGICTGDQAIFVRRDIFEQLEGFAALPLMEDIEISRRLKNHSRPFCIKQALTTSSIRWERHGIFKTILLMWRLRLLYFVGVSAVTLASIYWKPR